MRLDRGTVLHVWLPLIVGLWAFLVVFRTPLGPHGVARWFCLALGMIGLGGVVLARYTLGQSFSWAPKATELVTTGIYSRIRNPIYISGIICVSGMILLVGRPRLLLIFLALIPMQIIRARREAAVLEAKFGEAYREYRNHTWF